MCRYQRSDIADKIVEEFNFDINPVTLKTYCMTIEKFLKKSYDEQLKLAFDIYDFNSDGLIC
jgi:Ca2+-binding EF-hand superfamily protein